MVFEVAHQMALLPLLWLGWLHVRGEKRDVAWWWLVGIFFVSWLADTAAHWADPWVVSPIYLVTQAGIVGLVFYSRRDATVLAVVLTVAGLAALVWRRTPDLFLHTVAWGSAAGIVFQLPQLGRLRTSLLVTFGAGLIAWYGYALWPGWTSYLIYQSTRLLGIAVFCMAAASPLPHFKLSVR